MEYKAEDFISFIENNRRDKISPNGLELIAKRFRELECEVNKLNLAAVSGRSEQLKAFDELFDYAWNLAEYSEQHSKLNEIRERF